MPLWIAVRRNALEALFMHVVDDVDVLPPDILAVPPVQKYESPIKLFAAINDFAKQHRTLIPPYTTVIVNTYQYGGTFNLEAFLTSLFNYSPLMSWSYPQEWFPKDDPLQDYPEVDALEEMFNETMNQAGSDQSPWNPPV